MTLSAILTFWWGFGGLRLALGELAMPTLCHLGVPRCVMQCTIIALFALRQTCRSH
jgi:hypothetical protein